MTLKSVIRMLVTPLLKFSGGSEGRHLESGGRGGDWWCREWPNSGPDIDFSAPEISRKIPCFYG